MIPLFRASLALGAVLLALAGCTPSREAPADSAHGTRRIAFPREEPLQRRPLLLDSDGRWIGAGIAYGPYRDGQRPGGPSPTRAELREDLHLLAGHWNLLRLYEAGGPIPTILQVIREDRLDLKVMLGVWIDAEERRGEDGAMPERLPEKQAANRSEVESAIRLAAAYPEIVAAVCVGNETQVSWSSHRCPPELLIGFVREVRARTRVPVTVADDFNFWNKPESADMAREVDFVVVHAHPLWNGIQLEDALAWVQKTLGEVQAVHPDHLLVLGEAGWATQRHSEGEQAQLMKGAVGEEPQEIFYRSLTAWANRQRTPAIFFVAFDENWKGGAHPDEVEKHWGLFRADRTPKKALTHEP